MESLFLTLEQFGHLENAVKEELIEKRKLVEFGKRTVIVEKNQINLNLFFIIKGIVRYVDENDEGKEVTDFFQAENNLIAPAESFYFNIPALERVETIEDCLMYMLPFQDLQGLYEKYHSFALIGIKASAYYSYVWRKSLKDHRNKKVLQRYKDLLNQSPELIQRLPQYLIASYLDTDATHLSRIRSSL